MTAGRIWAARALALAADLVQIVLFPVFFGGGFSLANDVLDVAVAAAMIVLLRWHWAFLPTFLAELVPIVDLFPTWTAAVLFATRGGAGRMPPPGAPPSGPQPGGTLPSSPRRIAPPPG